MLNLAYLKIKHCVHKNVPKYNFIKYHNKQADILSTDIECNVSQLTDCNRNEIRYHLGRIYKAMKVKSNNLKQVLDYKVCLDVNRNYRTKM